MKQAAFKPSVEMTTIDSFNPEVMDHAVRNSLIDHVQLKPGRFQGKLLRANLGNGCWLDWGCYNLPLLARGAMPGDKITLGLASGPSQKCSPGILNGHEITGMTPIFMREGSELHYRLPGFSPWLALQLERSRLEDIAPVLTGQVTGPLDSNAEGNQISRLEMMAIMDVVRDIARGSPDIPDPKRCLSQINAHLLDLFTERLASSPSTSHRGQGSLAEAARLVRLATDLMQTHIQEPLRIGAICHEIDCDWKRLERAFLAVHGVTPKRYLALIRLNRARRLLLQANHLGTITWVASTCGIQHLGRFSREYFNLFSERPRDTLSLTRA